MEENQNSQNNTWLWASSVRGDLNRHMQELIYHLNHRANWLITINSFILVFIISDLSKFAKNSVTKLGVAIMIFGCLISLISLMLILVPYFKPSKSYKKSLDHDLFYFRNIGNKFTQKEFIEKLGNIRADAKELDRLFGTSIYNNSKVRLPSITSKLKIGGWSLIFALVFGSLLLLIGTFI